MKGRDRTVVLAGGGTGGHFFPALAVAEALRARQPGIELRYIGSAGGPEGALAAAAGMSFDAVSSGQVRGKSPLRVASSLFKIGGGTLSSARLLSGVDAVFTTGGYASVPVVNGAWLRRVPVVTFLPDVEPGWAVRATLRVARRIGVSVAAAGQGLPADKTEVTGYPVRARFFELDRESARRALDLPLDQKVILVSGASSGAQRLNDALNLILAKLLEDAIVLHSSGIANHDQQAQLRAGLEPALRERYHLYPLIEDMAAAMHAADLGVMRAGASVLGELPATRLPSILIPGTFAGGHQRANAIALVDAGAAVVLEERDSAQLLGQVRSLLGDSARLRAMSDSARALARPDAAARLAQIVLDLAGDLKEGSDA